MAQPILLVEDDEAVRDALADLLRGAGYGVATAGNGREALDWLAHNAPPVLILLDLMMPVMNGMEFLFARRKDLYLREIPVIVLTAWMTRWHDSIPNVEGVLSKPLDTDQLLRIVAHYRSDSVLH